jgi:hypothetical protein
MVDGVVVDLRVEIKRYDRIQSRVYARDWIFSTDLNLVFLFNTVEFIKTMQDDIRKAARDTSYAETMNPGVKDMSILQLMHGEIAQLVHWEKLVPRSCPGHVFAVGRIGDSEVLCCDLPLRLQGLLLLFLVTANANDE